MARVMKISAASALLLTVLCSAAYFAGAHLAMPFAITFGTCFYHFAMRLLVGHILNRKMRNRADYRKRWYQLRDFEMPLYQVLRVKKWKGKMPSYTPEVFDPTKHSWQEIAQAMCQAELVHEVIAVFSFLPLLAAIPFGAFWVFLITSVLSALFDLSFAIMQRYNRPRILRFIEKARTVQ